MKDDNISKYSRGRLIIIAILVVYMLFSFTTRDLLAVTLLIRILLCVLTYLKFRAARYIFIAILCTNSLGSLLAILNLHSVVLNLLFIIYAAISFIILIKNESVRFYLTYK